MQQGAKHTTHTTKRNVLKKMAAVSRRWSDQPGRIIAVFVVAPILLLKGVRYRDLFIAAFALILFVWDLYWLLCAAPMHA